MKRRTFTPHTPLPTSEQGSVLSQRLGAGLSWHWADDNGVVHESSQQVTANHLGMTVCLIDHRMVETLAPVTCLWCLSGRSFWK